MTAGAGILHIEKPPEALVVSGGLFHGFQLWVNLPARDKMIQPRYQDIRASSVALLGSADGGALVRLIAGDLGGHQGPGSTYTPIAIVHATVQPGAEVALPWRADYNALVYVLSGAGTVGPENRPVRTGQLAVLGAGDTIRVAAGRSQDSHTPVLDVYVMGGRPIREPVAQYGPFVMNTEPEIEQAFSDYRETHFGGWPWPSEEPVHPPGSGRFAKRPDGVVEEPSSGGDRSPDR